jgi:superfamily II DNA or RNA helicase
MQCARAEQASEKLEKRGVPHGIIAPGYQESKAFSVHVVSKDTLIRRYDKIKQPPDFCIIDEAHLALERYTEIFDRYPETKFLGTTATPERLDGRGLSEIYETLVLGPSIKKLIENNYLSSFRYFWPPLAGLETVHRRGTEYVADELEDLLQKRKIYGDAVKHYRTHADRKPCLVFCRSIGSARETASHFSDAGYKFECIDGTMTPKQRSALIQGLKDGRLDGLTSCELVTYGLDIPRVECVIMLRPTQSKTLFFQMIGRGLRPWAGKQDCIILDHVNNIAFHGHPLEEIEWRFGGKEKRKGGKPELKKEQLKLCPEIQYLYCTKDTCEGCPHNKSGRGKRELDLVDSELKEIDKPVKMAFRVPEERREIEDLIANAVLDFGNGSDRRIMCEVVTRLLQISKMIGRKPLWVYRVLTPDRLTVNVTVLHEIARQKKYAPGWVYFQQNRLAAEARKAKK